MQCEHVQRELVAFCDDKLPPQEHAAIEAHIAHCEACAEEATAMKEMGNLLSSGLKDWVNQGVCPPDVADRIEQSLRAVYRRPWWQRWPAVVTAAASVAAIAIIILVTQPQLAQEMASVPLLGAFAAQLANPDMEIHVDPQHPVSAALFRPTRTVDLKTETTVTGVTATLERVAIDPSYLRVQYTVRGEGLKLPPDESSVVPVLRGTTGTVAFHTLTVNRQGDQIRFVAYFSAVPEGEKLTLTVPALRTENGDQKGPFVLPFTN